MSNDSRDNDTACSCFCSCNSSQTRIEELERVLGMAMEELIILSVDGLNDKATASVINECEAALTPALRATRLRLNEVDTNHELALMMNANRALSQCVTVLHDEGSGLYGRLMEAYRLLQEAKWYVLDHLHESIASGLSSEIDDFFRKETGWE